MQPISASSYFADVLPPGESRRTKQGRTAKETARREEKEEEEEGNTLARRHSSRYARPGDIRWIVLETLASDWNEPLSGGGRQRFTGRRLCPRRDGQSSISSADAAIERRPKRRHPAAAAAAADPFCQLSLSVEPRTRNPSAVPCEAVAGRFAIARMRLLRDPIFRPTTPLSRPAGGSDIRNGGVWPSMTQRPRPDPTATCDSSRYRLVEPGADKKKLPTESRAEH